MTIKSILNSDMSVAYITDCATSPVTVLLTFVWPAGRYLKSMTAKLWEGLEEEESMMSRYAIYRKYMSVLFSRAFNSV
jgi:hypothetical protein